MSNGSDSNNWHGTSGNSQISLDNSEYDNIKDLSYRDRLLRKAKNQVTKNLIIELYREHSKIGDGGTADALIHEALTGESTKGKYHNIKANERISQINHILKKNLAPEDKELLEIEREKLKQALKIWKDKNKK